MLVVCHRVIWYADSRWNVLRDVCPHRLVPLSEGRIDESGQMECGYHGTLPLLPTFTGSPSCRSCRILGSAGLQILTAGTYHAGWAFTGDGTCTKIPQGGDPANPRSCAVAYPSTEKQELLWVKLTPLVSGTAINTDDIPIIPEVEVNPLP